MSITTQIIEKKAHDKGIASYIRDKRIQIVAEHEDKLEGFYFAIKSKPSEILINWNIAGNESSKYQYINLLSKKTPEIKIIIVGNELSQDTIIKCFMAGANGYLEYKLLAKFLNKAIKVVDNGEIWITRKMSTSLFNRIRDTTDSNQRVH